MSDSRDLGPVINRRLVAWSPDGVPVVKTVPMIPKEEIRDAVQAALSLPFDDPLGLYPEYEGMTNLEVMLTKAARAAAETGDQNRIDALLDRVLGRPKTTAETKSLRMTYEDWLKEQAAHAEKVDDDEEEDIFS